MTDEPKPAGTWHAQRPEAVLEALDSRPEGLGTDEVEARLDEHGPNRLPAADRPSAWWRLLRQFHNILIYVLLAASLVTALMAHWIDTAVILAVVVANAVIGFVQEGRAEQAMGAIRRMLALKAGVIRDGRRQAVPAEELVPGDIVLLEAGDRVPADLRLLGGHDLHIQEAVLTGESVPVRKGADPVEPDTPIGDRRSMAFSGTLVTRGQGRGVVVATGEATEIGRISGLLSEVESLTTPLVEQMDRFGRWLTVVILAIAALILLLGIFWREMAFDELFIAVVGLSVAAIPEGLPAVLTITLAIGVQAMARRQTIVRRLPAIETMGSVSVICTDKTGTLTRNEMAVTVVATADADFTVEGEGYSPVGQVCRDGRPVDDRDRRPLRVLARAGLLCNDADLVQKDQVWRIEGDPMEGALVTFAGRVGLEIEAERERWHRSDAIPFDAEHQFMATLDHDHEGHAQVFIKGAPERLFEMCDRERTADGENRPMDTERWRERVDDLASGGHRMLALAIGPADPEDTVLERDDIESGLVFLGLVGLSDPPRPEVPDAVAECRQAGIRVKVITGDHLGTATAIAAEIGLENTAEALTGADIEAMSDEQLRRRVLDIDVYARTNPEHKLRLVKALQALGHSVAMTGDGVNDAPALKRADAGIAMGQRGSEAAKEAADVVLADDHFASIVAGIREGRTVYDNVQKVISWTLPTNAGESMTIVVALLAGMTLPITPIQILWINLITATTLGLALAFEPTAANTMRRPPRPIDESILTGGWMIYIAFVGLVFLAGVFGVYHYAIGQGYSLELARTMAMNALVVMEIFQLFFIRNINDASWSWQAVRATRPVWLAVLVVVLAQLAMTYLPVLQAVFQTEGLSPVDGLLVVAIGMVSYVLMELYKAGSRRLESRFA